MNLYRTHIIRVNDNEPQRPVGVYSYPVWSEGNNHDGSGGERPRRPPLTTLSARLRWAIEASLRLQGHGPFMDYDPRNVRQNPPATAPPSASDQEPGRSQDSQPGVMNEQRDGRQSSRNQFGEGESNETHQSGVNIQASEPRLQNERPQTREIPRQGEAHQLGQIPQNVDNRLFSDNSQPSMNRQFGENRQSRENNQGNVNRQSGENYQSGQNRDGSRVPEENRQPSHSWRLNDNRPPIEMRQPFDRRPLFDRRLPFERRLPFHRPHPADIHNPEMRQFDRRPPFQRRLPDDRPFDNRPPLEIRHIEFHPPLEMRPPFDVHPVPFEFHPAVDPEPDLLSISPQPQSDEDVVTESSGSSPVYDLEADRWSVSSEPTDEDFA